MDASRTFETSWMGTLERQPLEEMELSGAFESSSLAGASGAAVADLAGDDEQGIISDSFSSTPASDTTGQRNQRRGSSPVGENKKRIKSITSRIHGFFCWVCTYFSNYFPLRVWKDHWFSDDGDKILNEETQCLLFSYGSGGAAGPNLRDTPASTQNLQQISKIDKAKHKVFLSHAGKQKDFVEQLCVDLEKKGYLFPFFDERQHSLPAGKDFVPLIMEAAQVCRVAVIVLSEEFLCSTWPMIELTEFHAAQQAGNKQLNMLPLFYKLGVDDLDDRAIEDRWMPKWKKLAEADRRIDVEKCSAAVRALQTAGGLVFGKYGKSKVGYRRKIVECIVRLSSADLLYGSSREMVGYDRMCEKVSSRFVNDGSAGPSVLGLYGTTGRGKTMLCKALCDHFSAEFLGWVCHVDLGEMTTMEEMMLKLKRVKLMLKNLCGFERDVLDRLTDYSQGLELLRVHVHREPVFLALDNVTGDEGSLREVREYLEVGFHPKSRILITSRSLVNVQDLLPDSQFCMAMPRLSVKEAGEIFLRSAAPMKSMSGLTDEERRIVWRCIQQCIQFESEDHDEVSCGLGRHLLWQSCFGSYHPLALSALGDFCRRYSINSHMLRWTDHLENTSGDPFKEVWRCPTGIGRMIGLQFSSLHPSEQLLFLDIALYATSRSESDPSGIRWLEWVSELHHVAVPVMERQLQDLTRSGMIKYVRAKIDNPARIWPDCVRVVCACHSCKPKIDMLKGSSKRVPIRSVIGSVARSEYRKRKRIPYTCNRFCCEIRISKKIPRDGKYLKQKAWLGTFATPAQKGRALDVGKYFLCTKKKKTFFDPKSEAALSAFKDFQALPLTELVETVVKLARLYSEKGSMSIVVPVPPLYREFAEWYATEHGMKGFENSWGVRQSSGLVRLRVFDLSRASARLVASKTTQELHNLEVLQLCSCPNLTELDLQGLDSLRHLELVGLKKLMTVTLSGSSGTDEDLGIFESLQSVILKDLDALTDGPDLRSCRSLHWLRVWHCPNWTNLEQISECRDLKDLVLHGIVPQQWASIPIVESLPSLQYFSLYISHSVDVDEVVPAVQNLDCRDQLENCGALMVADLLRHLRSVRVDDLSPDGVYNNHGVWVGLEWDRRAGRISPHTFPDACSGYSLRFLIHHHPDPW
ncbi:hypothetical protein KC19_9G054500 [Ceratodon purpureus]|uniref:TIR domain-containing protein n=1 Tax=Ceratodon purpureus TaxID=3225 RepID=A0A8T0GT28_CERPU|nr:hypothetical protein KC19_9G054500 [Ceratodon purpureus]